MAHILPTEKSRDLAEAFRKMMGDPHLTIEEVAHAHLIAFAAKLGINLRRIDPAAERKVIDGLVTQLGVEGLTVDSKIAVEQNGRSE